MAQGKTHTSARDVMILLSSLPPLCAWPMAGRFSLIGDSFWLPEQASQIAPTVDWLFYFIYAISLFFFALIVGLMTIFVIRYRRRAGVESGPSPDHNTKLELTWTLIPLAIVIFIFYQGFTAYLDMRTSPSLAYEINVIAKKWQWLFKYPDGHVDEVLHVPLDEPVRLIMTSQDVIHGLYIPAFRINMDVVPGRYNKIWFRAVEPGEYQLYCTQYCGTSHSDMTTKVVVHTRSDFQSYLKKEANPLKDLPPAKAGELLYKRRGCAQCHSIDGTAGNGPSFKGIFGKTAELMNARPVEVEENYIRESILNPSAKIVKGYRDQMPTFKGVVTDEEITDLVEFIKSLK
ncbi:MAG: cytochrome c oxidase subunit II [Thermoguttaceae bacterium]